MNLLLFHTIVPKIFIIKGIVKIKQDVTKKTWIGNVPLSEIDVMVVSIVGISRII
jgi:hypothetical protein